MIKGLPPLLAGLGRGAMVNCMSSNCLSFFLQVQFLYSILYRLQVPLGRRSLLRGPGLSQGAGPSSPIWSYYLITFTDNLNS